MYPSAGAFGMIGITAYFRFSDWIFDIDESELIVDDDVVEEGDDDNEEEEEDEDEC